MPVDTLAPTRSSVFFKHLDAKDLWYLRAIYAPEIQGADELTRGWLRGQQAFERFFSENLPRMSDIHSRVEDAQVLHLGDVELETLVLHQDYVYDGTRYDIEAPTTLIWRRHGDDWKLVLFHSVALPPV